MGSSLNVRAGGGRRRHRRRAAAIVDINMTPFIDVMLVLLIIFMVTAPLLTVGIPVELPTSAAQPIQEETKPITVSINGNREIYLQETQVSLDDLAAKLTAIAKNGVNERIFVRGDTVTNYGLIMEVMGKIRSAGFVKIGLVTKRET